MTFELGSSAVTAVFVLMLGGSAPSADVRDYRSRQLINSGRI